MRKLESALPSWLPWDSIFKDAIYKMSGNLLQPNSYYPFIYKPNCRALLQSFLLHPTGILGCLLLKFHKKQSSSNQDHPTDIIKNLVTSNTPDGYVTTSLCETKMNYMNFFCDHIWGIFMDDVASIAQNV